VTQDIERRTMEKVTRHLIPFMMLLYFVSFLDRVNVGFAALTMNQDLGFTPTIYGWGAGIFFFGYVLFEVPSNVLLDKIGARRWIARIMVTWGILAAAMAAVQGPPSFYAIRFLLGVAEAGFFPGMILYLTYWFPAAQRVRITATFMIALPFSSVLGGPLSSLLLQLKGYGGLAGWQWLFIVEGLPAVLLGLAVLRRLPDRPATAQFLLPDERAWLDARMQGEAADRALRHGLNLGAALKDRHVLLLGLIYFSIVIGLYGMALWLPQIVKGFGLTTTQVGFVAALPYLAATIGMVLWARHSDRSGERIWHMAIACFCGFAGLAASAMLATPVFALIALSVAAIGIHAALPIFWALPTSIASGRAAAGAIALINALGNLSGFVGPYMIGWLREATGTFDAALFCLSGFLALAAVLSLWVGHALRLRELQVALNAPAISS